MIWNRIELKEDSKSLLRLNYWPFVLVAFIHAVVAGSSAGKSGTTNAAKNFQNLHGDGYYGYDGYTMIREIVRIALPFLEWRW